MARTESHEVRFRYGTLHALKFFMFKLAIVFLIGIVSGGPATAADARRCETKLVGELTTELNTDHNQPELHVSFQDGRHLTLFGHNHGDPEKSLALLRVILRRKNFSDGQLEFSANLYRQDHQVALANFHRELPKIRKLLSDGDIKFIALEQPSVGVENSKTAIRDVFKYGDEAFAGRALNAEVKNSIIEDILLVQYGPVFTLQLLEPEQFRGVEIVGAEDLKQMQDANAEVEELALSYTIAHETFRKNGDVPAADAFKKEIDVVGIQDIELADLIKRFDLKLGNRKTPNAVWIQTLVSVRKMAISTRERNATILKSLVDRNESGALFIGAAHITGLQKMFQDYCSKP